jgi:hypothetical protein
VIFNGERLSQPCMCRTNQLGQLFYVGNAPLGEYLRSIHLNGPVLQNFDHITVLEQIRQFFRRKLEQRN